MISSALPAATSANNLPIDYPLQILVAGGAVSVLKYQSRPTTHDVDFYHPDEGVMRLLVQLGRDVARTKEWQGAFYWFNDAVANIINGDPAYSSVFAGSPRADEIVYTSNTLLLIAVDPLWQLHRKVSRISKGLRLGTGFREEDMADALYFLGLFQRHQGRPMTKSEFRSIYPNATTARISDDAIDRVAATYQTRYGSIGLAFQ
jgi:hypothetical protein